MIRRPAFLRISLATQLLILILLVTLISTLAINTYVRQQQLTEARSDLNSHVRVLVDRLSDFETLLHATHSFLYADQMPGTDLEDFIEGMELSRYLPSVNALDVVRFQDRLEEPLTTLGPLRLDPDVARTLQEEFNHAVSRQVQTMTLPFVAADAQGQARQWLVMIQPCAPSEGHIPCALYLLIDTQTLLQKVDELTAHSGSLVDVKVDGLLLGPGALGTQVSGLGFWAGQI
ncbi:hypothetical protein [Deinococcus radiophilus]|uniref:hypothetical protein n=1 Tax=Deinococcus radiophilus TaxID=32062 RepID=UPI003622B2CD